MEFGARIFSYDKQSSMGLSPLAYKCVQLLLGAHTTKLHFHVDFKMLKHANAKTERQCSTHHFSRVVPGELRLQQPEHTAARPQAKH